MSDLGIAPVGGPVLFPTPATPSVRGSASAGAFRELLEQVDQLQKAADKAGQAYALGENRDVASTLITIEKANLAFQLTQQIRNKVVEAYQEIMRMPV
jgi:flagellar hook-basal body complex protein FliE